MGVEKRLFYKKKIYSERGAIQRKPCITYISMEARICIPMMQIFPCNNLLVSVNESPDTDVCVFVLVFFITLMLLTKMIF